MIVYEYLPEKGKIELKKENKGLTASEEKRDKAEGKKIIHMNLEEFSGNKEILPGKKNLIRSIQQIQYCKLERYPDCIQGTMWVPKGNKGRITVHKFGFYSNERKLYFIEEDQFVPEILNKMSKNIYENFSLRRLLLIFFDQLLEDEVIYLQKQEKQLSKLEEDVLKKIPEHFYERILMYRRHLTQIHAYYEQLMNIADVMQTAVSLKLEEEEYLGWQLFANRAERLHNHVEMLRDYLVQVRELYQSQIDVQQNKVMTILTVVTTIFLPLTLIAGWYGMNFPNMPEFGWKYAYPAVIIVSVITIILEIIYFKKKKML